MLNSRNTKERTKIGKAKPGTLDYERIYMRRVFGLNSDFGGIEDLRLLKEILMYKTPMVVKEVLNLLSYWDERKEIGPNQFKRIFIRYVYGSNKVKGSAKEEKIDFSGIITRCSLKTYELAVMYILLAHTDIRMDELNETTQGVFVTEVIKKLQGL